MTPEHLLRFVRETIPQVEWELHPHPGYPERFSVRPVDGESLAWLSITEQGGLRTPTTWVQDSAFLWLYLKLAYAPLQAFTVLLPEYAWEPTVHGVEAQGRSVTFLERGMFWFCVRLPGQEPQWLETPEGVVQAFDA